jgi:PAS domain S-box-containing protein
MSEAMAQATAMLDDSVAPRTACVMEARPGLPSTFERRQRRALQGVALGFAVLVAVCLTAAYLAWQSNETTRTVLETLSARRAADSAMGQVLLAESSQRGFLLTHDPAFLPTYQRSVSDFQVAMESFKTAAQSDGEFAELASQFEKQALAKFQELDQTIALSQAGQQDQAMELVRSGLGKQSMDRARQTIDRLNQTLNTTLQETAPWLALLAKILLLTIGLASLCVIALSALVLRDTRRNLDFLAAREMALRKLAATLEERVERRTRTLSMVNQRFDAALRAANVIVFTQDTDLKFTWVSSADAAIVPDQIVGRSNVDVLANDNADAVIRIKQGVLDTGQPSHGEVRINIAGHDRWFDMKVHPLRDEAGIIVGLIGGSVDITDRKEQEARIRLLMREVTHRSKNLLSVIQAIMRQTATHSLTLEDFQKRFADRLHSLAGSHDLLVQEDWNGAALRDLIRSQLGHYSDLVGSQITLSGPAMHIRPDAAQHIGMALHELATNAAKYGALSVPDGKVSITWTIPKSNDSDGNCTLSWVESGGPDVRPPERRGFGRVVIERTVARALDGEVRMTYPSTGAVWELVFPRTALV